MSAPRFEDLPLMGKVPEAVPLLRVGRNQLYAAINAGEIKAIRIGRSIRIPRSELARLLGLEPDQGAGPAPPKDEGRPIGGGRPTRERERADHKASVADARERGQAS